MLDWAVRTLATNKVTVLAFHKVPLVVDPAAPSEHNLAEFERVLDFVCEHFQIVDIADAIAGLVRGHLPRRAACITFDDGYPDWIDGVLPALARRQAHATFFLTTVQLDGQPLWHERVRYAYRHSLGRTGLADPAVVESHLKHKSHDERELQLQKTEAAQGIDLNDVPRMTKEQLRHLHSKGFGVGAHTVNHPILAKCSAADAWREISESKEELESILGGAVPFFAYPNGRYSDFSEDHVAMVKRAGFLGALTTEGGAMGKSTSPFLIPRFTPWGPGPIRFSVQLARNLLK